MDMSANDIIDHLPTYLSLDAKVGLKKALNDFANSRDEKFYTERHKGDLLQGDIWSSVPIINYSSREIVIKQALVLSNTCDMANGDSRTIISDVTVAPIMRLQRYEEILRRLSGIKDGINEDTIESKLSAIRRQDVTNIFYLPDSGSGEKIVLLDRTTSIPAEHFPTQKEENLSTLNMLGFYMLIFKLSVHFCRLHEGVDRAI